MELVIVVGKEAKNVPVSTLSVTISKFLKIIHALSSPLCLHIFVSLFFFVFV